MRHASHSPLYAALLDDHLRHRNPANLRIHALASVVPWLAALTALSQVALPLPLPGVLANLGTACALTVAAAWLSVDVLVPALVLLVTALWAALPGSPFGPQPGHALGVTVGATVVMLLGFVPVLLGHIYYHEHAPHLLRQRRNVPLLILNGPFLFWLIALVRAGWRPALRERLAADERARLLPRRGGQIFNWARTMTCRPQWVAAPQTIDDLEAVVRDCVRDGRKLRMIGSGFSWSSFAASDEMLVFCEALDGIAVDLDDPAGPAVWAECGASNRQINAVLARHGLQLPYNVVLETVRAAGITSLGTHGSGKDTATMGDLVDAFEVIDGTGARRILSEATIGAEGMAAARVGLGLFGVIVRVRLRVTPADLVEQRDELVPLDEALDRLPALVEQRDSVELYWVPMTEYAWLRSYHATTAPPTRARHGRLFILRNLLEMMFFTALHGVVVRLLPRLLPATLRLMLLGLSRQRRVLPRAEANHYRRWCELRRCRCTEVGFKVDAKFANVRAAFAATRALVEREAARGRFPVNMIVNVRFIGPSGGLLSPAYGPGLACYIEALSWGSPAGWDEAVAELVAAWMRDPTALPHWPKEFERVPGIAELVRARLGERLTRFLAAREAAAVDPDDLFVNGLTARVLLGRPAGARETMRVAS